MQPAPYIPEDPLARFVELEAQIVPPRRWWNNHVILRLSCLGLLTAQGTPASLAQSFHHTSDELRRGAGWFGPLNSAVRFAVAATLVRRGQSAGSFAVELSRVQKMMREERLPRGGMREVIAILLLSGGQESLETPRASVEHLGAFYRAMKARKRLLTGVDDYPACVLLCRKGLDDDVILERVDQLYDGLRQAGFHRGNALQTASHLLHFSSADDAQALTRFARLYATFVARGLRMDRRDYALVATLSFLDVAPEIVVDRLLRHRAELFARTGARGGQEGFRLAAATAFHDLVAEDEAGAWAEDVTRLIGVVDLIAAQQAAVIASTAASSSAAGAT